MSRPSTIALILSLSWLITLEEAQAVPLIGNTLGAGGQNAFLYDVDPFTGAASNPRSTGTTYLVGIAFSAQAGLYGLTSSAAFAHPGSLYRINPATGEAQWVGATGLTGIIEGDLSFDPTTGELYGLYNLSSNQRQLFTVDPTTGEATLLLQLLPGDPSAMAFDSTGQLYVLDTSLQQLLMVNKQTGAVVSMINLSNALGTIAGMAFEPTTDELYVVDGDSGGTNRLYKLARSTGQLTVVGETKLVKGLGGLTFVPEPATLLLVITGGFALMRHRP